MENHNFAKIIVFFFWGNPCPLGSQDQAYLDLGGWSAGIEGQAPLDLEGQSSFLRWPLGLTSQYRKYNGN